ncbi:hypothetical protein GGX14DRAFT_391244 [Mycena pura]|uniref:Uncharacterized protein n=1 Tax=Mycena pura TaxID=153505 RepID=A0AAD6YJR1_9AGAR|nr:hypothetical protein GGX14DRAFT_391244 [Mycena pura]
MTMQEMFASKRRDSPGGLEPGLKCLKNTFFKVIQKNVAKQYYIIWAMPIGNVLGTGLQHSTLELATYDEIKRDLHVAVQLATPLSSAFYQKALYPKGLYIPMSGLRGQLTPRQRYSVIELLALQVAISDPDIDEVVESMKVEWTSVGRWLFALTAMSISLFTIDAQSLFKVDEFAQKAIAISTVATGLGILCNTWFLHRARCIYGSHLLFSLSAKFTSLVVIVSLGSLMAFGGRIVCNILPALVIVLGITLLIIIMGFRIIVSVNLAGTVKGVSSLNELQVDLGGKKGGESIYKGIRFIRPVVVEIW